MFAIRQVYNVLYRDTHASLSGEHYCSMSPQPDPVKAIVAGCLCLDMYRETCFRTVQCVAEVNLRGGSDPAHTVV